MTPRQAKLGVDVFTGAVIVSVAFALAGLTWRLQGEPGIGPSAAPVVPGRAATSDIGPLIALAPFGVPVAVANADGNSGGVILKGIFLARPADSSIVLIATADGKVSSYGVGSAVGGGVIESIEAEQISLRTPTGLQTIGFNPVAGPAQPANGTTAPASGTAQASPSPQPVFGVDAVRALIPPSAQGRPAPPPPAPAPLSGGPALAAAGIRPGDVIQQVNGRPVQAGTNERELMASAIAAGSARVEIIRDGQRMTLTVPVPKGSPE
jgi:general secretion pathway protein C